MQKINSIAEPIEKDIHLNIDEIFKRAGYEERGAEYRLTRQRIRRRTGETFIVNRYNYGNINRRSRENKC